MMLKYEFIESSVRIKCQKFQSGREEADVGILMYHMLASSFFVIQEAASVQMKH